MEEMDNPTVAELASNTDDLSTLAGALQQAGLATALLRQNFVDRFFCFVAPKVVGDGIPSIGDLGLTEMDAALTFAEQEWETVGVDALLRGYVREV